MSPVIDVIVLVGGFGTRLQSVVPDVPKPLAPVAGRPFLGYLLDAYAAAGMRRTILATGYRAELVSEFAGKSWNGMEIAYSHEDAPLGTGGAIRQAALLINGESAHVANGDTFLRYSPRMLERAAIDLGASMSVALVQVEDVGRYGAVGVREGRIHAFHEKGGSGPGLINAGSYFLGRDAIADLPSRTTFSFETDVLLPKSAEGDVAAYTDTCGFIDIGVPEDYARAQSMFATGS